MLQSDRNCRIFVGGFPLPREFFLFHNISIPLNLQSSSDVLMKFWYELFILGWLIRLNCISQHVPVSILWCSIHACIVKPDLDISYTCIPDLNVFQFQNLNLEHFRQMFFEYACFIFSFVNPSGNCDLEMNLSYYYVMW